MFGNVNYTYYSDTLGRSAVPTEADFNRYADDNRLFMKGLINDGIVKEREENGLNIAVCRMIEIDYLTAQEASGVAAESGGNVASESISAAEKKINIIKLYNDYNAGVC